MVEWADGVSPCGDQVKINMFRKFDVCDLWSEGARGHPAQDFSTPRMYDKIRHEAQVRFVVPVAFAAYEARPIVCPIGGLCGSLPGLR